MRFRYRQYLGGSGPSAEPDPPTDEAVAAAKELLVLVAAAEVEDEDDRAALATVEKALVRYCGGERAAVAEVDPRLLSRVLGHRGRTAAERLDAADHALSPGELERLAGVALDEIERARPVHGSVPHRGERDGAARPIGPDGVVDAMAAVRAAALRRAEGHGHERAARAGAPHADGPTTASAVSLLVDLSHSMAARGLHESATRAALALHALADARYPADRLQLVGFGETAREMTPSSLVAHDWGRVPGANLQQALRTAREHLGRHPELRHHVMVVTDGEPTAHTGADGDPRFSWPAGPHTVRATVDELDAVLGGGARVTLFLLADGPRPKAFGDLVARRGGARVLRAGAEDLGPLLLERFRASR